MRKSEVEKKVGELRGEIGDETGGLRDEIDSLRKQLGYQTEHGVYPRLRPFIPPEISLARKMDAICDYLEIDIVKVKQEAEIKCVKREGGE